MKTEIVRYKGKDYTVYNPGEIIKVGDKHSRLIIDQLLDGVTPMRLINKRSLSYYIELNYGITAEEYYIIVVFRGDDSKIPLCPICGKRIPFSSVIRGYLNKTCRSKECAHILSEKKKWEPGGAYERNHNLRSQISRRICKEQIKNGTHNFQNPDGTWKSSEVQLKLSEEGRHHWLSENGYSEKARERNLEWNRLGINPFQSNFPTLKADRNVFLSKGELTDKCYFYLAMWDEDNSSIKIGVTINLESRKNLKFKKSEKCYSDITEIYSDTRLVIAELEYQIKLHFYGKAVKGTETFPIEMKGEILEFAKGMYERILCGEIIDLIY